MVSDNTLHWITFTVLTIMIVMILSLQYTGSKNRYAREAAMRDELKQLRSAVAAYHDHVRKEHWRMDK